MDFCQVYCKYVKAALKNEISISLLLSSASDGTLSHRSSQPRALAACVYHCKNVPT